MTGLTRSAAAVCWPKVFLAAAIAVGGALAMTLVVGTVAMFALWLRGVSPEQVPRVLTTDASLPFFCAAAGVFTALAAGYITARDGDGAAVRQALAAGIATMAGHAVVVALLGSPLAAGPTAVYIGLTLPALIAGSACAKPAGRHMT